jgi:hypothetical protein
VGGVKRCPRCEETLPPERFYRNKRYADGCTVYCKVCHEAVRRGEGTKLFKGYTHAELRYRPTEHALEVLSLRELAAAWHLHRNTAEAIRAKVLDPDDSFTLDDELAQQLQVWLERAAA